MLFVVLLYAVRNAKTSYAVRRDGILERHSMQGVGFYSHNAKIL